MSDIALTDARHDRLLVDWQRRQEPALAALRDKALALIAEAETIYARRTFGYACDPGVWLVGYRDDIAALTSDLLANLHGHVVSVADEDGLSGALLPFEATVGGETR